MRNLSKIFFLSALSALIAACQNAERPTFSLLPGEDVFQQDKVVDNKIDIVWVIDNSGSMANLQNQMAINFDAFIRDFTSKNFDYKIAVTNTAAWRAPFDANPALAKFKDGNGTTSSGAVYITPNSLDPIAEFNINVQQGISGTGDERPFQSLRESLNSSLNSDFRRPDAFLAIIIVTDEDDFSTPTATFINEDYNHPDIDSVSSYIDYLDDFTGTTGDDRRYSVSGISILDNDCLAANTPHGNIAVRVQELVENTQGIQGDVCSSNFAETLDDIQLRINELSTQFKIDRELLPETISVIIDGELIPNSTDNGWSYTAENQTLRFHGSAVPAQGAEIKVHYEPVTIK